MNSDTPQKGTKNVPSSKTVAWRQPLEEVHPYMIAPGNNLKSYSKTYEQGFFKKTPVREDYNKLWKYMKNWVLQPKDAEWLKNVDFYLNTYKVDNKILNDFFRKKGFTLLIEAISNHAASDRFFDLMLQKQTSLPVINDLLKAHHNLIARKIIGSMRLEKAVKVRKLAYLLRLDYTRVTALFTQSPKYPFRMAYAQDFFQDALKQVNRDDDTHQASPSLKPEGIRI